MACPWTENLFAQDKMLSSSASSFGIITFDPDKVAILHTMGIDAPDDLSACGPLFDVPGVASDAATLDHRTTDAGTTAATSEPGVQSMDPPRRSDVLADVGRMVRAPSHDTRGGDVRVGCCFGFLRRR